MCGPPHLQVSHGAQGRDGSKCKQQRELLRLDRKQGQEGERQRDQHQSQHEDPSEFCQLHWIRGQNTHAADVGTRPLQPCCRRSRGQGRFLLSRFRVFRETCASLWKKTHRTFLGMIFRVRAFFLLVEFNFGVMPVIRFRPQGSVVVRTHIHLKIRSDRAVVTRHRPTPHFNNISPSRKTCSNSQKTKPNQNDDLQGDVFDTQKNIHIELDKVLFYPPPVGPASFRHTRLWNMEHKRV